MPLLGRRAGDVDTEPPARPQMRVLVADGQRIDLTSRESTARLADTRQGWQATAWDYRNMIGELRFAHQLLGRSVARARFYVAELRPHPADPIQLTDDGHDVEQQLADDAIANFNRLPFTTNPYGFTARLVENLATPGEAFVHIDAKGRFHVRSTSELTVASDGKVTLKLTPTGGRGAEQIIDANTDEILRCWSADPEWGQMADSPMRASLDICEDAVLAGREERAAARSRLAANGILLIPEGLSLVLDRDDPDDTDEVAADTFMADLTEAFLAPIRDDGQPQAVVPIVLRGAPEDLEKVQHITVQRDDASQLIARKNAAILRLLKSLDIQPEQVEGVGGTSHWNAWVIDARAIRDQVQPSAEMVAECLTAAFLRPALLSLGHPEDAVERIAICADTSALAENPNRGQDARDAHDRFAINDDALREALGFDADDAPDADEVARRMATTGRLGADAAAQVLGIEQPAAQPAARTPGRPAVTIDARPVGTRPVVGARPAALPAGDGERPVARPGETDAERPVPDTAPEPGDRPAITAATNGRTRASSGDVDAWFRVDEDACRALADIDAALTDRILVAADAAVARVVERAGARARSAVQRDRQLAATVAGVPATHIPAHLGRDRLTAFVPVADLVDDGYTRLRGQVIGWLRAAATRTGRAVCDVLGRDPDSAPGARIAAAVADRLLADVDTAWEGFAAALTDAAEEALFDPDATALADAPGEPADGWVHPGDVADLLAETGAAAVVAAGRHRRPPRRGTFGRAAVGGFATGPVPATVIAEQGGVLLARQWFYRPWVDRDEFGPHRRLNGTRFVGWSDEVLATDAESAWLGSHMRPGDHDGCRCISFPFFAAPRDPDGQVATRLRRDGGPGRHRIPGGDDDSPSGRWRDRVRDAVDAARRRLLRRGR